MQELLQTAFFYPAERAQLDEPTKETAKKIYELAKGLSYRQFVNAIKLSLEDSINGYQLSLPPVPKSSE